MYRIKGKREKKKEKELCWAQAGPVWRWAGEYSESGGGWCVPLWSLRRFDNVKEAEGIKRRTRRGGHVEKEVNGREP